MQNAVYLAITFQSYLSPIQTRQDDLGQASELRPFNPTLVQFKPEPEGGRTPYKTFQSYLSPIQTGRPGADKPRAVLLSILP